MRILILSNLYPPHYKGGHEIQCKVVADGLSSRGHQVFVLTSRYGVYEKRADGKLFRLLYYLDDNDAGVFRRRYNQLTIALFGRLNYFVTGKIIKELKPDLVYAGELSGISIFPIRAIQRRKISIVHHLGNYFLMGLVKYCSLEKNLFKRFYRKIIFGFSRMDKFDFNHLLTVSEAVKKQHLEVGFSDNDISVIPRGISSELIKDKFEKFPASSKKKLKLLYVGRIAQEKGVHISIEAVGHLTKYFGITDVVLDIIGDGDTNYNYQLKSLINKLRITKNVRFCGKLPREKVLNKYSKYDILLLPSVWEEPFSGVLIEAMSQGLPIVATDTGGTPELIKNNYNGLLVPPNNSAKMAEYIKRLIENPSLYEQIRINGIKKIKEEYTNEKIIEQIDKYINDVFNQSKRNFR